MFGLAFCLKIEAKSLNPQYKFKTWLGKPGWKNDPDSCPCEDKTSSTCYISYKKLLNIDYRLDEDHRSWAGWFCRALWTFTPSYSETYAF